MLDKKPHLCKYGTCRRKKAPKKAYCHKHHAQHQKETNAVGYAYSILKQNARRRGKEFTLTLEDFREFCDHTGYLLRKGRTSESASIDRIDSTKGYTPDNIQVLSFGENSAKGCRDQVEALPFYPRYGCNF